MYKAFRYLLILAVLTILPASAFGWGSATHAWLANGLGLQSGSLNMEEIYGSMLPDLPNYMADQTQAAVLFQLTHYNFMEIVEKEKSPVGSRKASEYGFASHNEVWGGDYTAHTNGFNTGDQGYVIAKSEYLAGIIAPILGIPPYSPPYNPLLLSLAHSAIESGIDLRLKRELDPQIGFKIILSAESRSHKIPQLLVSAYAKDFAYTMKISQPKARSIILKTEEDFRQLISMYGGALTKSAVNDEDIWALAQLGAQIYSSQLGLSIEDASIKIKGILDFVVNGDIVLGDILYDYQNELSQTFDFVKSGLAAHGIDTARGHFALLKPAETDIQSAQPVAFLLKQNFPNPFNPKTTIEYLLPVQSTVRLSIFNSLGQEIALLVNSEQSSGLHTIIWDGSGFSSGTYFCRIEANGLTAVQRMQLLK
jgi:hypothetical protein